MVTLYWNIAGIFMTKQFTEFTTIVGNTAQ